MLGYSHRYRFSSRTPIAVHSQYVIQQGCTSFLFVLIVFAYLPISSCTDSWVSGAPTGLSTVRPRGVCVGCVAADSLPKFRAVDPLRSECSSTVVSDEFSLQRLQRCWSPLRS